MATLVSLCLAPSPTITSTCRKAQPAPGITCHLTHDPPKGVSCQTHKIPKGEGQAVWTLPSQAWPLSRRHLGHRWTRELALRPRAALGSAYRPRGGCCQSP